MNSDHNNLYIVILNWNGWSDTLKCIESIQEGEKFDNYTIVLVDNGSEEKELTQIRDYCMVSFKLVVKYNKNQALLGGEIANEKLLKAEKGRDKIVIIENNENMGFAPGNNVALKYVLNIGGKYAMLLNNDTEVQGGALLRMFDTIKSQSNCGAIVPQIRYYNPANLIWNCGGRITWYGARKYYYFKEDISKVPQSGIKQVDYATGCALLMDLSLTGILSEKYFFGEEDFELSLRLKANKIKEICLFDAIVFHKVGASRKKVSQDRLGPMCYHYSMRLSDLKDYQNTLNWYISVFAHIVSSFLILRKEPSITIAKFLNLWKQIFFVIRRTKVFTREVFLDLSKKQL